jgi:hypothetical protein
MLILIQQTLLESFDPSTILLRSYGLAVLAVSIDNASGSAAEAAHESGVTLCAGGIDGFQTLAAALVAHGFRPMP